MTREDLIQKLSFISFLTKKLCSINETVQKFEQDVNLSLENIANWLKENKLSDCINVFIHVYFFLLLIKSRISVTPWRKIIYYLFSFISLMQSLIGLIHLYKPVLYSEMSLTNRGLAKRTI